MSSELLLSSAAAEEIVFPTSVTESPALSETSVTSLPTTLSSPPPPAISTVPVTETPLGSSAEQTESIVDVFCEYSGVDKTQLYVGVTLLILLFINIIIISVAWKHYTPIIASFRIKEEQYKAKQRSERGIKTVAEKKDE